jgi:hypothetical protein
VGAQVLINGIWYKTLKIVGDATYRTQAEAENGMKIIKVCIAK